MIGPITRIIIRYGLGAIAGAAIADTVLNDVDLMNILGFIVSAVGSWGVEHIYNIAKRRGWAT